MPILFIGHGSPMNAITTNSYTKMLSELGHKLPKPKAILCISAHWMTNGTFITHMENPKTIHDFYGFPKSLFDVQYNAPGSSALAEFIQEQLPTIQLDEDSWGLDHGAWSVLRHLYPEANIPVLQLSLDIEKAADFHFAFGKKLQFLRDEGVLILGSGNIVHNLSTIQWDENAKSPQWALDFDLWMKARIDQRDFDLIVSDYAKSEAGKLSVPTPDHFYPLLYILGAASSNDSLHYIFEGMQNASISMRSVQFG